MGKGMFSGAVWGAVSGVAVMALLSLYAPLPGEVSARDAAPVDQQGDQSDQDAAPASTPQQSSENGTGQDQTYTLQDSQTAMEAADPEPSDPTDLAEAPQSIDQTQTEIAEADAVSPAEPMQDEGAAEAAEADVPLPEIVTVSPTSPAPSQDQPQEVAEPQITIAEPKAEDQAEPEVAAIELDQTPPALLEDAPTVADAPEVGTDDVTAPAELARAPEPEPVQADPLEVVETDTEVATETPTRSDVILVSPEEAPAAPVVEADAPVLPVSGDDDFDTPERPTRALAKAQPDLLPTVGDEEPAVAPPQNTELALELQSNRSRLPTIGDEAEEDTSSSAEPITLPTPQANAPARKVVTNRLPSITAPSASEEGAEESAAEATDAAQEPAPTEQSAAANALQSFAAEIDVPADTDLVALILIDDNSAAGMPIGDLLQLAVPFSVAIDPSRIDAADRAAQYRAAGIEVLAILEDLPQGAAPSDVAVAMDGYFGVLDEAIGVLDPMDARIQSTRSLIPPVLDALSAGGRVLITYDQGLNSAQQLAQRQGVPAATVFRILDAEAEEAPKIKRYLDRAAFNANRDGSVVVLGRTFPETVKGLLEWSLSNKGAGLSVVPVSALLLAE